jgi:hypothetical protein
MGSGDGKEWGKWVIKQQCPCHENALRRSTKWRQKKCTVMQNKEDLFC